MTKRRLLITALIVIVVSGVSGFLLMRKRNHKEATAPQAVTQESTQETKTGYVPKLEASRVRLIATGDMLPHDSVNQQAKTADGYNYRPFFSGVEKYFQASDVRFCNQETPSAGTGFGISGYPTFNAPEEFAKDLSAVGCNVINLANNHINDKGQAGIDKTLDVWKDLKPLAVAGANHNATEQQAVRYFTVKGIKFAFVAYAEYSNDRSVTAYGLNILNEQLVNVQLREARKNADIVLVSVHWGTEYSPDINNFQTLWSNTFASLGADIVLGTGPHVLEPVKRLPRAGGGETLVWYSLGNFLSTQLDIESLVGGFAMVDIDVGTKKVTKIGFFPTYMHYEWTADEKQREDLLKRKNLKLYPLDLAEEPLKRSQNATSVAEQRGRVSDLLNIYTPVTIVNSDQF
jgi:poly-gamma-glutamate capsule biosynthesis protein CapA/YwtB (metallophosphatase superfamily)